MPSKPNFFLNDSLLANIVNLCYEYKKFLTATVTSLRLDKGIEEFRKIINKNKFSELLMPNCGPNSKYTVLFAQLAIAVGTEF